MVFLAYGTAVHMVQLVATGFDPYSGWPGATEAVVTVLAGLLRETTLTRWWRRSRLRTFESGSRQS